MKRVLISLWVGALVFSLLGVANANLILNGDFETVDDRTGKISNFALDGLGLGLHDVYDALPDGMGGDAWYAGAGDAGIEVQRNTIVTAHSGSHYIELDSHDGLGTTNSSMSQDIQFLVDFEYYLSFYYRPRPDNPVPVGGGNGIEVYFDDPMMSGAPLFTVDGLVSEFTDWRQYTVNLGFVMAGQHNLKFIAIDADDRLGGFLDDVTVTVAPVPEPATMLLLGTGLVGLAGFRKKFRK